MFDEMAELGDRDAALPSPDSFDTPLAARPRMNPHQEIFELAAKLARDYATLTEGGHQDSMGAAVERALGATSQLCEIMQYMALADVPVPGDTGEASGHLRVDSLPGTFGHHSTSGQAEGVNVLQSGGAAEQRGAEYGGINVSTAAHRRAPDILLVTTLVTAYILLVRNWRCTFSRLHRLVASASERRDNSDALDLPSLQIGGFQVRGNPAIQVLVLLELASGMLQTIESTLGITYSAGCGSGRSDSGKCWAVFMDPVVVSIRETLLSQERVRAGTGPNVGEVSLKQMMEEVKRQLDRGR
jgi:hypothetical protein